MGAKIKYAAKVLLGVLLVTLLAVKLDWRSVRTVLWSADPLLVAIGAMITSINVPVGALRWHILVRPLAGDVRFADTLRLVLIGNFFNALVPGGLAGDVVRGVESNRSFGLLGEQAFSSVVIDRVMALVGLVLLAAAGLGFGWQLVLASGLLPYALGASLLIVGGAAALYVLASRRGSNADSLARRASGRLARVQSSLLQYRRRPSVLALAFVATLVSHGLMIASIYCLARSLGATTSFRYYVLFVPIISIMTALPLTVGGLGIRDAGYVLLFPLVGMTREHALGTSFIFFLLVLAIALVGGAVYLWPRIPGALRGTSDTTTRS